MILKLKEDPKEWRKAAALSAIGLAVVSTVLRWRHVLNPTVWIVELNLLAVVVVCACLFPRWFRGYYRVSSRAGFALSQFIGYGLLAVFFLVALTPLGLILRLFGKDLLRLKRQQNAASYWNPAKESSPLDRLF